MPMSRRSLLSRSGAAVAGLTAIPSLGAGAVDSHEGTERTLPSWPQRQYDAARTGAHPSATGPTKEPELLWTFQTPSEFQAKSYALVDGTLFAETIDGTLYAIDARTGVERWRFRRPNVMNQCPAVVGDTVFAFSGTDGTVFALERDTGQVKWTFEHSDALSDPAVADGTLYFVADPYWEAPENGLYALDTTDGRVEWHRRISGASLYRSPTVGGGGVYVGTGRANRLYAFDAASGEQRWQVSTGGWLLNGHAYADGTVYVQSDSGILRALDAASGTEYWRQRTQAAGPGGEAYPVIGDGRIYIGDTKPYVTSPVHALDATTGERLWRNDDFETAGSMKLADGVLYAGDLGAIDAGTGETLWQYKIPGLHYGAPVPAADLIFKGSYNGVMYALTDAPERYPDRESSTRTQRDTYAVTTSTPPPQTTTATRTTTTTSTATARANEPRSTSGDSGPGLGVLGTLGGAVAGLLLARRWQADD